MHRNFEKRALNQKNEEMFLTNEVLWQIGIKKLPPVSDFFSFSMGKHLEMTNFGNFQMITCEINDCKSSHV